MMADVCIVCEALLQSCLENLLCDQCRKPAETCLEKEFTIDEGVEDTPLHYFSFRTRRTEIAEWNES